MLPYGLKEKILRFVAFNLVPRELRYWIVIRTWSEATTGRWSSTDVSTLTYDEAMRRSFEEGTSSKAYCECGHELLNDINSKIYEQGLGNHTNIICSRCDLQTSWDLDAPVPIFLTSHPKPTKKTESSILTGTKKIEKITKL